MTLTRGGRKIKDNLILPSCGHVDRLGQVTTDARDKRQYVTKRVLEGSPEGLQGMMGRADGLRTLDEVVIAAECRKVL
jgi:hypothetical protein